jgi:hypothetical protein
MGERQNTVVCSFEPNSPKISAFDIHEWIFTELRIPERDIVTIQIDTINRHVYIKMVNADTVHALLDRTGGQVECKHSNGEISRVHMAMAGLRRKKVRIANLAPEVANEAVRAALTPYGKIQDIYNEKWSTAYRYSVDNGIRQVICLIQHVPSHLTIAGQRMLLSYEGQPATYYACGKTGHLIQGCPTRSNRGTTRGATTRTTYAAAVAATMVTNPEPATDEGEAPAQVGAGIDDGPRWKHTVQGQGPKRTQRGPFCGAWNQSNSTNKQVRDRTRYRGK